MKIELRKVSEIKPYEKNPRLNDAAVEAVAASIREFGFRQPIVVDEEGVIIVGHTRYKAALKLGLDEVPVHVATGLSPEQVKAYRIADNQTASLSQWNYDLLPLELADLQKADFDLNLTGFSSEDILRLVGSAPTIGLSDPDDIPEPPDQAITKPGDLWLLGENRLLCADAGKPEDVDRLLDGAPVHLVNTDPPYLRDDPWRPPVRRFVRSVSLASGAPARTDLPEMAIACQAAVRTEGLKRLAHNLGLSTESLSQLGTGWSSQYLAWTFPMVDASGNVIGIRLRRSDGSKFCILGSK